MNIINEIKKFVENECKKTTSKYGYEPFIFHFTPVANYAQQLCDEIGGDKEIITIAAWLHDIGSIIHERKNHHITGAEITQKKLEKLQYPKHKIELIKKCILNHRGSKQNKRNSIEEQIIAEADAMSAFESIAGLFKAALVYEKMNQEEAKISVREKLIRKYKQLHFEKSKKIIKPKYDAAMLLLK